MNAKENNTLIDAACLTPWLRHPATLSSIQWYKQIPSTNLTAKTLGAGSFPHRGIVLADYQSAGRGRLGRSFYSPTATGIYVSVLYRPEENPALPNFVTMAACVCTARAIAACCGKTPAIKWVNDLYLDQRKICGILAEAGTRPGKPGLDYVIVGIGINLYPPTGGFPKDIQTIAGSVMGTTAPDPDLRLRLIAALIDSLWELGSAPSPAGFIADYRDLSMVTGKHITLRGAGGERSGLAAGFTDEGHLILQDTDGTRHIISSGEISLIFND